LGRLSQLLSALGRLDEARATVQEAQAKNLDSSSLHLDVYLLAFLQGDTTGMAQQVAWSAGKPGVEDLFLVNEAETQAYFGRLGKARELSRQAVASAKQAEENEVAANYETDAAVREALFGNAAEARARAEAALELSNSRDVQYGAALALALDREYRVQTRVDKLAHDLATRFPEDTVAQFNYLPTIRAQLALDGNHPSEAIAGLQAAAPYELGLNSPVGGLLSSACVDRRIWPCIRAAKPRPSSKRFSTIAPLSSTNPLARSPILASDGPMPSLNPCLSEVKL